MSLTLHEDKGRIGFEANFEYCDSTDGKYYIQLTTKAVGENSAFTDAAKKKALVKCDSEAIAIEVEYNFAEVALFFLIFNSFFWLKFFYYNIYI